MGLQEVRGYMAIWPKWQDVQSAVGEVTQSVMARMIESTV